MNWHFINTGKNSGKFNMDFDLQLAESCEKDKAYFRLYRWSPYCISLGANQKNEQINIQKTFEDNIDVVVRPTGGRAILHSEELTYSVILPISEKTSAREFYHQINSALLKGLTLFDPELSVLSLETEQPDLRNFYKEESSSICFAVSAKSEINFKGKKLAGSAQRKLGNRLLQHGSILTGNHHKKIIEYLNISSDKFFAVQNEIENKTIDLKSILKKDINMDQLSSALRTGFEDYWGIKFSARELNIITELSPNISQII